MMSDSASRRRCGRPSGSVVVHHRSRSIHGSPFSATRTSKRLIPHLSERSAASQTWSAFSRRRPRASGVVSGIRRIASSSIRNHTWSPGGSRSAPNQRVPLGSRVALLRFDLLPQGFRNRELRETVAALCGLSPDDYGAGRMTYDLRRLRLRGIIERIPRTQRYRLTAEGLCVALAYHRTQARVLGPVLSATLDGESTTRLREAVALYDREVDRAWNGRALAA